MYTRPTIICIISLLLMCLLSGCTTKEVKHSESPSDTKKKETAFIQSFAKQNNAIEVSFDNDLEDPIYSLDLQEKLHVFDHKPIAFECFLLDVNKKLDKYYIYAETEDYPDIKYKLECTNDIAQKVLKSRYDEFQNIAIVAFIDSAEKALLNISTDLSTESEPEISIDTYNDTFIATGICLALDAMPEQKESD